MSIASLSSLASDPYLITIVVYLLALLAVGVYKTRAVSNSEDFMVAGRSLPWYILVGTLLATWIGNGSLFGGAGLGYRNGLSGLWSSCGAWVGIMFVYYIAGRVRNFGKVTVPDIFDARYGKAAGLLATLTTVVAYLTIVSYQFKGGGLVLSVVTNGEITVRAGIVITAVFAIGYTVLAGMLSVVYTDVVNGVLMLIGILSGLGYMIYQVGGPAEVARVADELGCWSFLGHWDLESVSGGVHSPLVIAISFMVPTMLLLLGDSNVYQRIFSAKNSGSARKAVAFWVIGVIVLESAISLFGLTGAVAEAKGILPSEGLTRLTESGALNPEWKAMSETVISRIALGGLPIYLGMVLVATMMAVIVSTADSFLLVPATNLTRDVYQRFFNPNAGEKTVVLVSRIMILVLGGVAYLLVDQFPTILAAAYTAYLIYGTSITPALLAAFTSKRATATGAVASIVTGASITLIWQFGIPSSIIETWHPLLQEVTFPAATLSVLALIVGSMLTAPPPEETWKPFFVDEQ